MWSKRGSCSYGFNINGLLDQKLIKIVLYCMNLRAWKWLKSKTSSALPNCQRSKFSECFQMDGNQLIGFYEPWDIVLIIKELEMPRTTVLGSDFPKMLS